MKETMFNQEASLRADRRFSHENFMIEMPPATVQAFFNQDSSKFIPPLFDDSVVKIQTDSLARYLRLYLKEKKVYLSVDDAKVKVEKAFEVVEKKLPDKELNMGDAEEVKSLVLEFVRQIEPSRGNPYGDLVKRASEVAKATVELEETIEKKSLEILKQRSNHHREGTNGDDTLTIEVSPPYGPYYVDAKAGNDTVSCPTGVADHVFFGGDGNDALSGGWGDDILLGGDGNDILTGFSDDGNNDVLTGSGGRDVLVGGEGQDTFVLDSKGKTAGNRIGDFSPKVDTLKIGSYYLSSGSLPIANFQTLSGEAKIAQSSIFETSEIYAYQPSTGNLFYSGLGSNSQQILVARLSKGLNLTSADIIISSQREE